ncbi:MAG: membrane protein insertase YidC [Proteobacteria bacterium]|nr:membrane protein insertase YidC [Pseudomonadota bacterium]
MAQDVDLEYSNSFNKTLINDIQEVYVFKGIAGYLNQLHFYIVDGDDVIKINANNTNSLHLSKEQWLTAVGRFKVLVFKGSKDTSLSFEYNKISVKEQNIQTKKYTRNKTQLEKLAPELEQLRYQHLWYPFALLAKLSEFTMVFIKQNLTHNWGLAVLLFAVVIKVLLLPISILTIKYQRTVSEISTKLQPKLKEIKSKYDGEQAHNRLMQAHKDLGVSPFYTLKPMACTLIQIPILIAIFNALGEMSQFNGQSFLWIKDLAYPEDISPLPFNIPFLGNHLNLLPFLMISVTIISTLLYTNSKATVKGMVKQKRNLYIMGVVFFILFYPFPSAMVMYWVFANTLQIIQQKFIKI